MRRRFPRWRRAAGLLALFVLLAGGGTYYYYTRPERLRAYAEQWLAEFSGGEARVERVEFDPLRGFSLMGVTLALPVSAQFDPADTSLAARTLFRCSTVLLRLQSWRLLRGELVVPEVVAVDPELVFIQRSTDGADNWQTMLAHRRRQPDSAAPANLPTIRLRNARLVQYRLSRNGPLGRSSQTLWAEARPLRDQPHVYELSLTKLVTDPNTQQTQGDSGRLRIDTRTLALSADRLPAVGLEGDELLFAMTPEVRRWKELLDIRGTVRAEDLEFSGPTRRLKLTLSDAGLSVPIDESEESLDSASRYIRFEHVGGTISLDGTAGRFALEGSWHGAPVRLTGTATIDAAAGHGLDALGLDLKLEAESVPLPRNEPQRDATEARFVNRWKGLRNFVRDFDGRGPADLSVNLRKAPGSKFEFLGGEMRPGGASARYVSFPYLISNMTGTVGFRSDGTVTIDLKGMHGGSVITFSGWEGGFKTQAGDLVIRASDMALDDDLRRCLTPEDQQLCERFGLQARIDLDIHLTRADAPPGTPDNPWKAVIDVLFRDGMVRFDSFPYPLDGLRGRMRIAGGAFEIAELTARRGDTVVSASGTAQWSGQARPSVDLELKARNVAFDSILLSSLPDSMKDAYRRLNPSGQFELSGRLKSRAEAESIEYDLGVRVADGAFSLPTGVRITDVAAAVQLRPERVTIQSAKASLGESVLSGEGWLGLGGRRGAFSARVTCDQLRLDDDVRQALPESVRQIWDDFHPAGAARVALRCERARADGGAADVDGGLDYSVVIEPLGASAMYEDFPLALEDLRGSFTVSPQGVEIRPMQARSGGASMYFSGRIERAGEHKRARLSVQARRLPLDESLRQALPRRIRRQWDELKPRGEIDVDFQSLEFVTGGDPLEWRFAGRADLRNVAMELGSSLSDVDGTVRGSCEINDTMAVDAELALDHIRIDERVLNDAVARVTRPAGSDLVRVELVKGRFYDGEVSARAELDYAPSTPGFSVKLDTRGVSLEKFMNARRKTEEPPVRVRGIVDARLELAGGFGDPPSRRGGGEVKIREAQIVKIPWMLSILQVLNLTLDDNAFDDALFHFRVSGEELLLSEIDLRGKALSMVGAGVVNTVSETLDLTLLAGGPVKLPHIAVLSDILEGVAREVMEVRVEGTLENPTFRAEMVKSLRRTVEALLTLHQRGVFNP